MDDPSSSPVVVGLIAIIVLVLLNAFFVATEFALVGARSTRLQEMVNAGNRKARLAQKAVRSLDRYISATQLGITLASLGLGWIGEPALAHVVEGVFAGLPDALAPIATHSVAVAIAFSIITVLHIILGELMPKAVAILYPEKVSVYLAAPIIGFAWVMYIPITILNGAANALLNLMHINPPGETERLHSPEEIRMLVEQSRLGGELEVDDARLLKGVFRFSEKRAEEVMTPRTKIMGLEAAQTLDEAADEAAQSGRSRYPVYDETLDDIVGIIHTKDLLTALRQNPDRTVRAIMRPALFLPGTRQIDDVLTDMKRLKTHMAMVLDEYGGTAGLVTMEDLLEEIVGEIFDEHDPDVAQAASTAKIALLDGTMPISEFNEQEGTQLDDSDYTTLGGFLFGALGRLPKIGDRIAVDGGVLEVAEMEGRRVRTIRLARQEQPD